MMIALLAAALAAPSASACACPESIGSEAGSPPLIVIAASTEHPGVVACGYLESREGGPVRASEFEVFECGTGKSVLTFDASRHAFLEASRDGLLITEIARWPFGSRGEWMDVATWKYAVVPGRPPVVSKEFVLQAPKLSDEQVAEVLQLHARAVAAPGSSASLEELIGRLLAATLSGSEQARTSLLGLDHALHLDGSSAEVWTRAIDTYHLYATRAGEAPRGDPAAHPTMQPAGQAPAAGR